MDLSKREKLSDNAAAFQADIRLNVVLYKCSDCIIAALSDSFSEDSRVCCSTVKATLSEHWNHTLYQIKPRLLKIL